MCFRKKSKVLLVAAPAQTAQVHGSSKSRKWNHYIVFSVFDVDIKVLDTCCVVSESRKEGYVFSHIRCLTPYTLIYLVPKH